MKIRVAGEKESKKEEHSDIRPLPPKSHLGINWVDFVLMFVIGFLMIFPAFLVTFFVEWIFFGIMQDYSSSLVGIIVPLIYLLATLIPASAFYILRNKDDRKTFATITIAFGISFWIVAYILLFLISAFYASSDSGLLT